MTHVNNLAVPKGDVVGSPPSASEQIAHFTSQDSNMEDLSVGTPIMSQPALTSWGPNRLDLFGRNTNGGVTHAWWNGTVWSSESLGGAIITVPTAVSWGVDRLDVFALSTDSACAHRWWDGHIWHAWESLGGTFTSAITAVSGRTNGIDLFGISTKGECLHRSWRGSRWTGWENINAPGVYVREVKAVAAGDTLNVFITSITTTTNPMYHGYWDGTRWVWNEIDRHGGSNVQTITAIAQIPNHIDLFTIGWNHKLLHNVWNGNQWGMWETLGDLTILEISACRRTSTTMELFAMDTENHWWHKTWKDPTWSEWESNIGSPSGGISCIAISPQRFDAISFVSSGLLLRHYHWNV